LLHLHGKQKQTKRLDTFQRFTSMKSAFLFATDIAARGLDFPAVDWVIQLDAPEDAETYIHRVGRTARYQRKGQSLLFLLPSEEEGMLRALRTKAITPEKIQPKESKTISIQNQLQSFAFQDPELKYLGQRVRPLSMSADGCVAIELSGFEQAFVSYVRSVHLHRDKEIFKIAELPLKEFAASLGLPGAPKVKFVNKDVASRKKNAQYIAPVPVGLTEEDSGVASSGEEETHIPSKGSGDPSSSGKDKVRKNILAIIFPFLLGSSIVRRLSERSTTGCSSARIRTSFQNIMGN
jgi:ATP-dependent RNA helicase DDX10/DBP4